MRATIFPGVCSGAVRVPASKSMAHRGLICAALAGGTSAVHGLTLSQDITATQKAMQALGAHIEFSAPVDGFVSARVTGCGGVPRQPVPHPVHCCESGSTLRFLIPLFSLTGAPVLFTGEGRLLQRPQGVYQQLFAAHGAAFAQTEAGITVQGALPAGTYTVDGSVSSQFISGLLFALPLLGQESRIAVTPPFESRSYVQLTLQAMADFGVQATWQDANTLLIPGGQAYTPCTYTVEGDYSQAAFFAVLAAAQPGAVPLVLQGLRAGSCQGDSVVFEILKRCGAQVQHTPGGIAVQPPVGGARLQATAIDLADCPDLGPILMVLGLFCEGETVLYNAGRLRMKESDRIAAMESEVRKMGGSIRSEGDKVFVRGSVLHAAHNLDSHNDHRIVMAMAVAALAAGVPVTLAGAEAVNKSYPHFFSDAARLGVKVETDETN